MGTKQDPGPFDCYANALPDEPMFVLLARDPEFCRIVTAWAAWRVVQIEQGLRPDSDYEMVWEARTCALAGARWHSANYGKWRKND